MIVAELIAILSDCPGNMRIVVPGFTADYSALVEARRLLVVRNPHHTEPFVGEWMESIVAGREEAILIGVAGSDNSA